MWTLTLPQYYSHVWWRHLAWRVIFLSKKGRGLPRRNYLRRFKRNFLISSTTSWSVNSNPARASWSNVPSMLWFKQKSLARTSDKLVLFSDYLSLHDSDFTYHYFLATFRKGINQTSIFRYPLGSTRTIPTLLASISIKLHAMKKVLRHERIQYV